MNFLQLISVAMLVVTLSSLAMLDERTGETSSERRKSRSVDEGEGILDYEWNRILKYAGKYMAEKNEYSTSQDGWLEIYRRQQTEKQRRGKSCQVIPPSLEEIKEDTLQNPHARLFTEADRSGTFEVYDFKSPTWKGGCYNLKREYEGKIKSVDISMVSCVRLFSERACSEWSQAMYPGSTNIPNTKLNGVYSIGPCVTNEFEYSTIKKYTPSQLEKLPSALESFANVPDLIGDAFTRSGYTSVETSLHPIISYSSGPGNRVEALKGWIYPHHLKSPESAEKERMAGLEQRFYSKLELEDSDEPGFVFPLELGGPADQIYNVFPQNQKQAGYFKGKIVPLVKKYLTGDPNQWVLFNVNFAYKNSTTRRPSGMWYKGHVNRVEIFYGYVPNSE